MYYFIKDYLESIGYRMVTPYDFAKPGKECKYVKNAWKAPQQLLLGFGPGAETHYLGGYISANVFSVNTYINAINDGILPWTVGARLTKEDLMTKYMVLGVRGLEIDKVRFKEMFNMDPDIYFKSRLEELLRKGWMEDRKDKYVVTREGLWFAENISKILYDESNKMEKQPGDKHLDKVMPTRLSPYNK